MTAFSGAVGEKACLLQLSCADDVDVVHCIAHVIRNRHGSDMAIAVVADVTLIVGELNNLVSSFGVAFRYAEERGVTIVDILPFGARRAQFQAAYEQRQKTTAHEELCGELADTYKHVLPGIFSER